MVMWLGVGRREALSHYGAFDIVVCCHHQFRAGLGSYSLGLWLTGTRVSLFLCAWLDDAGADDHSQTPDQPWVAGEFLSD